MSATGRSDVRRKDDFYATPGWCTRSILPHLSTGRSVLDPCCGDGAILVECQARGLECHGIELRERGGSSLFKSMRQADALDLAVPWNVADCIITNPPYSHAMGFVMRAIQLRIEAAFLLRLNWLGGQRRAAFHRKYPSDVYVLPRRPSFVGKGTDATEYAWCVWGPGRGGRWSVLEVESSSRGGRVDSRLALTIATEAATLKQESLFKPETL